MSIKKIVGLETEFRLDCAEYPNLEDFTLPWQVVENAACNFGGAKSSLVSPQSVADHTNIESTIETLKTRYPSSGVAIKEHLGAKRREEKTLESKMSHRFHFYQRFGFSGGYLPAGFRIYVDGSHPEVSTPECASPEDLVCWQKAGEKIIELGRKKTEEQTGHKVVLSNDNSDGLGESWGSHENYLVSNKLFEMLIDEAGIYKGGPCNIMQDFWISFLITRFVFCGSGKIGSELGSDFQHQFLISQRAEFITRILDHSTMHHRPLINTRDIPYVGNEFGRRLHVIVGDSNMCEISTYLKIGTAMIMLMMLEDEFISKNGFPTLIKPINCLRAVMADLSCKETLEVYLGGKQKRMTAVDIQKLFCELAGKWFEERYKGDDKLVSWIPKVISRLDQILNQLKNDPMNLFGTIDWVTKYSICCSELDSQNADWSDLASRQDPKFRRLIGICGAYHRLDDLGIYNRLKNLQKVGRVVNDDQISRACIEAPEDTRANERGKFIRHFGSWVDSVNWEYIYLKCNPYTIIMHSPYAAPSEAAKRPL